MKKAVSLLLVLVLILGAVPASALTVGNFVKLYNKAVGNGPLLYPDTAYIYEAGNVWFLEPDARCQVAVIFTPVDGADPLNYPVNAACVVHKSDVSVGYYLNCICAAVAALFPEVPESERMSDIMRTLVEGVRVRSYSFTWDDSVYYITNQMGLFTYQEKEDAHTFLIIYGD